MVFKNENKLLFLKQLEQGQTFHKTALQIERDMGPERETEEKLEKTMSENLLNITFISIH